MLLAQERATVESARPVSPILSARIMEPSAFDELAFFTAIAESGVRALLIGRRALVLLGLPVLTADYDFWLAMDDIVSFNAACAPFGLTPTRTPDAARQSGRYALENDEHVDVLVARSAPTVDGVRVQFESLPGIRRRGGARPCVGRRGCNRPRRGSYWSLRVHGKFRETVAS